MKKSLFGLSDNIVSAIAYVGLCFTGLLVYLLEKEDKAVRFHGLQSTILFAILLLLDCVCGGLLGWIPIIGGLITWVIGAVTFLAWIFLTFSAYKGHMFKVPVLGDAIWEHINK